MTKLEVVKPRRGKPRLAIRGGVPPQLMPLLREVGSVQETAESVYADLDYYVIRVLLDAIPDAVMAPNLHEWYTTRAGQDNAALRLKELKDIDLPRGEKLLPYQRVGANFLAQRRRALLTDQPGLGKTAQVIIATTIPEQAGRVLVICPNALKLFWQAEIERWNPGRRREVVNGKDREDAIARVREHGGYLITNYDIIPSREKREDGVVVKVLSPGILPNLLGVKWDWVILDEAHRVKNRKAKIFKCIKSLDFDRIALLTGTPMGNDPSELWTLLHLINPKKWTSFWKFFDAFVHYTDTPFGRKVIGVKNASLLRQHLAPVMLRRTREQVGLQIPEPRFREIPLHLLPAQVKAYREMARQLRTEIEGEELRAWSPGAKLIRLRQIVSTLACFGGKDISAKLDALMELIEDEGPDEQWVVFSQFRATVDAIEQRCRSKGISVVQFKGGDSGTHVAGCVDAFRKGKAQVLAATMGAGGEGHNLQTARHIVRVDLWYNPNVNEQAMHRVVRLGQNREVVVTDLHCPRTVDDLVKRILERKEGMTDAVLREELMAHLDEYK